MSAQFLRRVSLLAGSADGEGLDLSGFRVRFDIRQADVQTPNRAIIRVYNLSAVTATRVQREFTQVTLRAGYEGSFGVIFRGTIKFVRQGRENPVDTFLDIFAADGDIANNFSVVNRSVAAGSRPADTVRACLDALAADGVEPGFVAELPGQELPRGKVLFGMTRDHLTTATRTAGATWSIQNGACEVIPRDTYLPGTAAVVNSSTGMIGLPEQTQDGVNVRVLLNPNIRVNGRVIIDEASVQRAAYDLAYGGEVRNALLPSIAADGTYRVIAIDHEGDTHAQPWYSVLTCIDVQGALPLSQAVRGRS